MSKEHYIEKANMAVEMVVFQVMNRHLFETRFTHPFDWDICIGREKVRVGDWLKDQCFIDHEGKWISDVHPSLQWAQAVAADMAPGFKGC